MINKILTEQELEAINGGEGNTIPQAVYYPKDGSSYTMVLFKNHNCVFSKREMYQKRDIINWANRLKSSEDLGNIYQLAHVAVETGRNVPRGDEFILIKRYDTWELYED